jgi:hypothetical protein
MGFIKIRALKADIITATGLDLLAFGGVKNWIRSHLTYLNPLSIRD